MKYLSVLFLALAISLASCEPAPKDNGGDNPKPNATETSSPEPRDKSNVTAGKPKLTPQTEKNMTEGNAFSEFSEKYPLLTLPTDFPWVAPELAKAWVSRPVDKAGLDFLCGEGKIKCAEDEQAFHAGRFERAPGVHALFTYLQGDFNERVVLSTHDAAGKMIASEEVSMTSEELTYGYSSTVSKSFKVFRSEMFYRMDDRTGKQVPEVDHEDIFVIGEDGSITKE